ncbi:MAG: sulfatase-like hydrolase/transferase [Cytophagaceae bacterium]|nr:sulfatase-like hydrolase/transferase [Cytophagaceae bacterium]
MIVDLDENIGRLVQRLQALGLAEYTILIFTTDNGSAAGASLENKAQVKATTPEEGGHRVPFFIRYPAGGTCRNSPRVRTCCRPC